MNIILFLLHKNLNEWRHFLKLLNFKFNDRSQYIVSSAEDGSIRIWKFQEVFNAPKKNQRFVFKHKLFLILFFWISIFLNYFKPYIRSQTNSDRRMPRTFSVYFGFNIFNFRKYFFWNLKRKKIFLLKCMNTITRNEIISTGYDNMVIIWRVSVKLKKFKYIFNNQYRKV